jgi:hypothetical protein
MLSININKCLSRKRMVKQYTRLQKHVPFAHHYIKIFPCSRNTPTPPHISNHSSVFLSKYGICSVHFDAVITADQCTPLPLFLTRIKGPLKFNTELFLSLSSFFPFSYTYHFHVFISLSLSPVFISHPFN